MALPSPQAALSPIPASQFDASGASLEGAGNGASLTVGGALNNASIGSVSGATAEIDVYRDPFSTAQALLNINSAAGFGTAGVLTGAVLLQYNSLIEFTGGQITSIDAKGILSLGNANSYIADAGSTTEQQRPDRALQQFRPAFPGREPAISASGSFTNNGTLTIDDSAGKASKLTVGGSYTQGASAYLVENFDGTGVSPAAAVNVLGGAVTLNGGTLSVDFPTSFLPKIGETFTVMTFKPGALPASSERLPVALLARGNNWWDLYRRRASRRGALQQCRRQYPGEVRDRHACCGRLQRRPRQRHSGEQFRRLARRSEHRRTAPFPVRATSPRFREAGATSTRATRQQSHHRYPREERGGDWLSCPSRTARFRARQATSPPLPAAGATLARATIMATARTISSSRIRRATSWSCP